MDNPLLHLRFELQEAYSLPAAAASYFSTQDSETDWLLLNPTSGQLHLSEYGQQKASKDGKNQKRKRPMSSTISIIE